MWISNNIRILSIGCSTRRICTLNDEEKWKIYTGFYFIKIYYVKDHIYNCTDRDEVIALLLNTTCEEYKIKMIESYNAKITKSRELNNDLYWENREKVDRAIEHLNEIIMGLNIIHKLTGE